MAVSIVKRDQGRSATDMGLGAEAEEHAVMRLAMARTVGSLRALGADRDHTVTPCRWARAMNGVQFALEVRESRGGKWLSVIWVLGVKLVGPWSAYSAVSH